MTFGLVNLNASLSNSQIRALVPLAIAEFGQKCLEMASTLKYEPLR